ncbi:uncharacterized protein LOC134855223 isoform X2 [Symsagittifera roscoffensis]|uniref:uncharacterized protein LOC134855223 isoform X2 n=1 Tax=Symsagittifera roscoffensis TaxID=84072 RepID=UPI00307C3F27
MHWLPNSFLLLAVPTISVILDVGQLALPTYLPNRIHRVQNKFIPSSFQVNNGEYKNDIALLKLSQAVGDSSRVLPICRERATPVEFEILGASGMGATSTTYHIYPTVLQEGFFFQTLFEPNPTEYRLCRSDQVCVESATEGANICHFDDGIPLYTFECESLTPKCLYGVASYYRSRLDTPGQFCNGGSFFASVTNLNQWIRQTMMTN